MKIRQEYINPVTFYDVDEFGDYKNLIEAVTFVDQELDYDFMNDEIVELERMIDPVTITPNDGLRYSIINILSYMCGLAVNDYMVLYTKQNNSYSEDRPCALFMKNEFLFKRLMLTSVKKNYASIQELQEGNIIPESESLDIKGLAINKSTLNDKTQKELQKILYEDVLRSEQVDQSVILKKLIILEKKIYNSLVSGSREYYKPVTVKAASRYEDPMRISGIKASIVWNELTDSDVEKIDLNSRNSIELVKVDISPKNVEKIKDKFPEVYARVLKLFENPKFAGGINAIAIPLGLEVPEFIIQLIDYKTIINDNLKNFPLESIGIVMAVKNTNVNYTNTVSM